MGEVGIIRHAAIYKNCAPSDIRGRVRYKHHDHAGDFVRLANSFQWDFLQQLFHVFAIAPDGAVDWRFDRAWANRQHAHAVRRGSWARVLVNMLTAALLAV